ncbi:MAG: putative signal transducing protein [Planctomycetota bacterium]
MAEKLVTIAQFTNYIEAEMAKQLLADYGIEAVATGENASNMYSIPAVEGPELQVLESQAQQALEILESHKKPVDAAPDDAQEQ